MTVVLQPNMTRVGFGVHRKLLELALLHLVHPFDRADLVRHTEVSIEPMFDCRASFDHLGCVPLTDWIGIIFRAASRS